MSSTGETARAELLGENSGFCIFGGGDTADDISDDGFDYECVEHW